MMQGQMRPVSVAECQETAVAAAALVAVTHRNNGKSKISLFETFY